MNDSQTASIREVYQVVNGAKAEIINEISKMRSEFEAEQKAHEMLHVREKDYRSSLTRWAVTSVLSGMGVLAAIIIAVWKG